MKQVPRHLDRPPLDTPILQWWANEYDFVYAILNPFFKVPSYSPSTTQYGVTHVGNSALQDIINFVTTTKISTSNDAADDFDSTIKRTGQQVLWSDVQRAIGAEDFVEFARTVWLWVVHSDRSDKNLAIARALTRYCDENHVYPPEEDVLPAVLEPTLSEYLRRLSIDEVTIWSEWRDKSLRVPAAAFDRSNPVVDLPGEKCSGIAAEGFFLSWEFDDVVGLLCLTEELHLRSSPLELFEGFAITPSMYSDVLNPVDLSERNLRPKLS